MIHVKSFTFNPFQENTYILYTEEGKSCIIIDPGCSNEIEINQLTDFISQKALIPERLINTHCHIDHVLGNQFVHDRYQLTLEAHEKEIPVLGSCEMVSKMYGIPFAGSPEIESFLSDGETILLEKYEMVTMLTPGHSPGSLCFYSSSDHFVIGGDVLFLGSVGRTDLPGGDYDTLMNSIQEKLLPLPENVVVHPGHGPATTIGQEKKTNPFLRV